MKKDPIDELIRNVNIGGESPLIGIFNQRHICSNTVLGRKFQNLYIFFFFKRIR